MTKIRAAVCRSFREPLTIEEIDLRAPTGREVEVTLEAVAICHSDVAYIDGYWGGTLPAVFGHEAAGRITAMGQDVEGYALGQRVVATLIRACGTCPSCSHGRPVGCSTPGGPTDALHDAGGAPVWQAMNSGAFAEKILVDVSQLAPVDEDIAPDVASLLACGVITGFGAVRNSAHTEPGEDVVVIGAGGVGLNAIQGARVAGAARIVAVDMNEEKLATAKSFGATDGVLATAANPPGEVRARLGRGADAVFVTVGAIAAYNSALDYVGPGGKVVVVGMPPSGAMASFEPASLAGYGQKFIGTKMGDAVIARDIPYLVGLYREGTLMLDELISNRWSLDEINEAIADTRAGGARRNVIVF